jgi:S-formylglutathione hydrolase FrmB
MTPVSGRTVPTWLDGFGEWTWPGLKPAVELTPASWVPALPRIERPAIPARILERPRSLPRPLRLARLVLLVAVAASTFVLSNELLRRRPQPAGVAVATTLRVESTLASPFAAPTTARVSDAAATLAPGVSAPLPQPVALRHDSAGATIAAITYASAALGRSDRFLVYLPPGYYASKTRRYPVLYLLHGYEQPASSFLRLGVESTLDGLIDSHAIRPLIAVMLEGASSPQDWLNTGGGHYYSYVSEVRQLTDRVLRTIPSRASRGIAGYSMGGFGAMNVALTQLQSYSLVESWEGDFTGLSAKLGADRSLLQRMPLRAFVWGGAQDTVVDSALDAPWAAAMRSAGAQAQSAVYPGAHAFAPIESHLRAMLSFAGRALRS